MASVGGNGHHRLRRRLEEQVVDHRLVVEGDGGDGGRQREDHVEKPYWQQVGLALGEPGSRRRALAFGAVPVAAAVVGDAGVAAVPAALDVAAARRCAAGLDGRHDLKLVQAQVTGVRRPPGRSVTAEDVGDLDPGAHRGAAAGALALHQEPELLDRARHRADRPGGDAGSRSDNGPAFVSYSDRTRLAGVSSSSPSSVARAADLPPDLVEDGGPALAVWAIARDAPRRIGDRVGRSPPCRTAGYRAPRPRCVQRCRPGSR